MLRFQTTVIQVGSETRWNMLLVWKKVLIQQKVFKNTKNKSPIFKTFINFLIRIYWANHWSNPYQTKFSWSYKSGKNNSDKNPANISKSDPEKKIRIRIRNTAGFVQDLSQGFLLAAELSIAYWKRQQTTGKKPVKNSNRPPVYYTAE